MIEIYRDIEAERKQFEKIQAIRTYHINMFDLMHMDEFEFYCGKRLFGVSYHGEESVKLTASCEVLENKLQDFHKLAWRISKQVFTQEELATMKEYRFPPHLQFFLNAEGNIVKTYLFAPKEGLLIFTADKTKKLLKLWQQINLSDYVYFDTPKDTLLNPKSIVSTLRIFIYKATE